MYFATDDLNKYDPPEEQNLIQERYYMYILCNIFLILSLVFKENHN